jgi:hypothetical protein
MAPPYSLSDELGFSTVRIESTSPDGRLSIGTAFFFRFPIDTNNHLPILVTNKHVIEGALTGRFLLRLQDPNDPVRPKGVLDLTVNGFGSLWTLHPDSSVDLCALPVATLHRQAEERGHALFYKAFDPDRIVDRQSEPELQAVEDVLMIGYPIGIWDSVNNWPVYRRGITASHPALEYEGHPRFLIDAACFPGSSGSPIIHYSSGVRSDRAGNISIGSPTARLLGVLYAGPQYTAEGKVVNIPVATNALARTDIPSNLGLAIKARRILDLLPLLKATG